MKNVLHMQGFVFPIKVIVFFASSLPSSLWLRELLDKDRTF